MLSTSALPALSLLKSIIRYFFLCPPPMKRIVIFPVLLRPPDLERPLVRDFSGFEVVISSKLLTILNRCPGVVGFNFLNDMILLLKCYRINQFPDLLLTAQPLSLTCWFYQSENQFWCCASLSLVHIP